MSGSSAFILNQGSCDPTNTGTRPQGRSSVTPGQVTPPRHQTGTVPTDDLGRILQERCHTRTAREKGQAFA